MGDIHYELAYIIEAYEFNEDLEKFFLDLYQDYDLKLLNEFNEEYNKKYEHFIGKYVRYIGSMTFSGNLITCIKVKDTNFNYDKSLGGNYAEFEGIGYSVGFDGYGKTMISVSECMKFRLFDSDLNSSENTKYGFEKIKEIDEETYKSFLNETIDKVVIN